VLNPNQPLVSSSQSLTHLNEDTLLLPDSPFPLIQQTQHLTTNEVVWAIHPCQVAGAVREILKEEYGEGYGPGQGVEGAKGLKWLETWMMLSGNVVDLVHP
jgi:hypothetical protein